MRTNRATRDIAGLALLTLVILVVLVVVPIGYVVRVLVRTRSCLLLDSVCSCGLLTCVAVLTQAAWLTWLAILTAGAVLVVARVEAARHDAAGQGGDVPPLPFEGFRW